MKLSERGLKVFLQLYSVELVSIVYRGILAREADLAGLSSYSKSLKRTTDLTGLLKEFSFSDEQWEKNLSVHAPYIVHAIYQGLLGRDPEPDALADYATQFAATHDLASLLMEIGSSDELWNRSLAAHAPYIVHAIYQGLLGREPDPQALADYAAQFAATHDLASLLMEIGSSDEMWNRSLAAHAPYIVHAIYQGLLGREPDPQALADYAAQFAATHDLASLLAEISASEEHRTRCSQFNNETAHILDAVFHGLLSRPADDSALSTYLPMLQKSSDLAQVISIISCSDEFKFLFKEKQPAKGLSSGDRWGPRIDYIDALYRRYHHRCISSKELSRYIESEAPLWEIHRGLLYSPRQNHEKPRVLIFGAYGNGNLGDAYQALALRAHLISTWKLADTDIFSCSLLSTADYPYPDAQKLPPRAIYDTDFLNSFDYLIIGGGGLLSHPHDPLYNEDWVMHVTTPIIVLGVAATLDQIPRYRLFLEHALYVSGRDRTSIAAMSTVRSDVEYAPDPILSLASCDELTILDQSHQLPEQEIDVLWILKYPSSDSDRNTLNAIRDLIQNTNGMIHVIAAIEPARDNVLDEWFPDMHVMYLDSLSPVLDYIASARAVFSMRYHGAIFTLIMKRSGFGSSQIKIYDLFNELGTPDAYIKSAADIERVLQPRGITLATGQASKINRQFTETLQKFQSCGNGYPETTISIRNVGRDAAANCNNNTITRKSRKAESTEL